MIFIQYLLFFIEFKESDCQTFYGIDQNGNSLSLSVNIGIDRIAELKLCVRLSDGNTYVLPGNDNFVKY